MLVSKTMMVPLGTLNLTVEVTYRIIPGEAEVRYYADGSGYPGSPAEVDCVDSAVVIEIEYPVGPDGDWNYRDRRDIGGCVAIADRWALDVLNGGKYNSELLDYESEADYDE